MTSIASPPSRNAPCPCGSGLRYKECHGSIAAPPDGLEGARSQLERGDIEAARRAGEALLRASPDEPAALELLARCAAKEGKPFDALRLWLRAARAVSARPASPSLAFAVWTSLTSAFVEALRGLDADAARARRDAYRAWIAARRPGERGRSIAVILIVSPQASREAIETTLGSIAEQTRLPAELVVAPLAHTPAVDALRARGERLPFPVCWIDAAPATKAAALDAAVAASRSHWVVAVEPPHAFAPTHLAALAGAVEERGAQWGYADATIDGGGATAEELAAARASLDAVHTSLAKIDSIGQAFIDGRFAAVGDGAVLFSRDLHAAIGGFRPLAGHELWDFALRATLEDELVRSAAATYRHAARADERPLAAAERDAVQLAMFRPFYAAACSERLDARNPFAPTLRHWGLAFLRRVFQTGHVLMVDLDTLERFAQRIEDQAAAEDVPSLTPGINLLGIALGEFGLGENLRAMARACDAAGVPFVVNDLEYRLNVRQTDRRVAGHLAADLRHALTLMCVNPDLLAAARPWLERARRAGGRSIGYWYWELETLPPAWHAAIDAVDELWCATEFIAGALRRATSKPVVKIPPALEVSLSRPYARAEFGLPEAVQLFLFTFDYNSYVARKNPGAVITAFRNAFADGRDDVGLVVKSVNGVHWPDRVARIDALIGGDRRIRHLDAFLDRDASYGLISVVDCYVSLHRAEGLGLGLAEAMLLGKPTIATGYSGNLEFMSEANSLLVSHRLVPVAPGEYMFDDPSFFWADADIEDASRKMRRVVDDAALRMRLAEAGPPAVHSVFGRDRAAALLRARLAELRIDLPEKLDDGPAPT